MATVKEIAQLGATLGREFSYELLHAVSPLDEETLQQGLKQLVEAELVYQRGLPPQATISSSMRSFRTRPINRYSRAPGSSITSRLPRCWRTVSQRPTRPSPSWWRITTPRRASSSRRFPIGSRQGSEPASARPMWKRSAHLTKGLELLKTLPDTPERTQQELTLQLALGTATDGSPKAMRPQKWNKPTPGRGSCASRWGRLLSSSRCCWDCGCFISCGRSSRRHVSWRSSS